MSSTQLELNGAPHWIDQVADLLPEERRLAWYRDLSPWLRGLPPQDELQDRLSRLPAEIAKGVSRKHWPRRWWKGCGSSSINPVCPILPSSCASKRKSSGQL